MRRDILTIILTAIAGIGLAEDYQAQLSIQFDEKDFQFNSNSSNQLLINYKDVSGTPEIGCPRLPLVPIQVKLPYGSMPKSVSVDCKRAKIAEGVLIAPVLRPVPTNSLGFVSSRSESITEFEGYNCDFFPKSTCEIKGYSSNGKNTIAQLTVSPFEYHPASGDLYLSHDMAITINYSFPEGSNKERSVLPPYPPETEYVIITSKKLEESFRPLANWKNIKGVRSEIITVEDIQEQYSGPSLQNKIKQCLESLYRKKGLKYALLGGDNTVVPVRGCYGFVLADVLKRQPDGTIEWEKEEVIDEEIPADLYYACFAGNFDWDANKNGIFGELDDEVDMYPFIYVSRAPVQLPEQASAFVDKTIEYEKNPKLNGKFLIGGCHLFENNLPDGRSDSEALMDNFYELYIQDYWKGKSFKFFDTNNTLGEGPDYKFINTNLQEQLGREYDFVYIATHGRFSGWDMEGNKNEWDNYKNTHAMNLTNKGNTFIATSACSTNAFDHAEEYMDKLIWRTDGQSLSEGFTRNPYNGVIGYLGCSRLAWGDTYAPGVVGPSDIYNGKFLNLVLNSEQNPFNYGRLVADAKISMLPLCYTYDCDRWIQFGLNPIGDPEMPIYSEMPLTLPEIKIMSGDGHIKIDCGTDGCTVAISDLNNPGGYYKRYDSTSQITVTDIPPSAIICVTKPGYKPKTKTLKTIQGSYIIENDDTDYDCILIGSNLRKYFPNVEVEFPAGHTNIVGKEIILSTGVKISKGSEVELKTN